MTLDDIEEVITPHLKSLGALGATVKFDLGDEGFLCLDGTASPATLSRDDREVECVIKMSSDNFAKMVG
ncbi:MAG: Sterol-binding protein, partial [Rhodospirillales bacterium]|nr:Sterol-binding protein [Rhodospirillales bacterium]